MDDPWDIHSDLPRILPVSFINFQPSLIPKGFMLPQSASSRWAVEEWQACVLYPKPMVFPEQHHFSGALALFFDVSELLRGSSSLSLVDFLTVKLALYP
jgi:hypothetical protein